ncbi:IS200/IS605 family transposase [bacterium]|nr:IS200/IS605 family transposase [bacterium]
MSHSFSNLLTHIIFSTKGRRKLLSSDLRPRLFPYMGGIIREIRCKPIIIGGVEDHVHLLIELSTNDSVAKVMSILKANSSRWIHDEIGMRYFEWQRGYAALSVSQSMRAVVERYIARQEEHHKKKNFREELSEFLKANGIQDQWSEDF